MAIPETGHSVNFYFRSLPIASPALKENSCKVDHSLLFDRVRIVALTALQFIAAICVIGVAVSMPPVTIILGCAGVLSIAVTIIFADPLLSIRASNAKAVEEYLTKKNPSLDATFVIQHSLSAAKLLISKGGDLKKINENGDALLDYFPNFDVFKLLVDHGAYNQDRPISRFHDPIFLRFTRHENPAFLEYLLKKKIISTKSFSNDDQCYMWTTIGSVKTAHLLKEYGFNPNVRDNSGRTPLMKVATDDFMLSHELSPASKAKILLECGADKSLTLLDRNGSEKTALQLCIHPEVARILTDD